MGYELNSIHRAADPRSAVESAQALFVGGGNTLLPHHLHDPE